MATSRKKISESLGKNLFQKQHLALAALVNSVEFSKNCTMFANQD
jgi:hypothetical protein